MHASPAPGPVSTVTTFDDGWYRSITDFARQTAWLNGIMSTLTVALIVVLALMVVYAAWRSWRAADREAMAAGIWAVAGSVLAIALGMGLKQVFQETRPCLALSNVTTVQPCPGLTDYSFPSDHTTVAVALAAGLWLINRRLGAIGAGIAVLEGFSRVYLGQHYPHDVLAAFVLSCLVVLGGWVLIRKPLTRLAALVPSHGHLEPAPASRTHPAEEIEQATHAAEPMRAAERDRPTPSPDPAASTGRDPHPSNASDSGPASPSAESANP